MPLPVGFESQAIFASDDEYAAGAEDWAEEPNKLALTGIAQGIVPGEAVPAEVLNMEWWKASTLALAHAPIEALNWTDGDDPTRVGLNTFLIIGAEWIAPERLWIAVGLAGATKRVLMSYNGRHWSDQSPGGFPGALNLAVNGEHAIIFVADGDFYRREPDGFSGVVTGPISATTITAWADASGSGADNVGSWMADPDVDGVIWIGARVGDVATIIRIAIGGYSVVNVAETDGLDAFDWAVTDEVSFTHQAGKRIVCFVVTDFLAAQSNQFRWSTDDPSYLTNWNGSGTNTIRVVATHGKVVGLGKRPDGTVIALTSTGRVYLSADLQTWTRIDNAALDDETREFYSCVQVGAITYARGSWARPSTGGFEIEGIFHSLDYGETWCFEASPLRAFDPTALDAGRRLRGHGDRLSYVARNTAADVSEIAHSFLTGPTRRQ